MVLDHLAHHLTPLTATALALAESCCAWRALSAFCCTVALSCSMAAAVLFQRAGLLLGAAGQVVVADKSVPMRWPGFRRRADIADDARRLLLHGVQRAQHLCGFVLALYGDRLGQVALGDGLATATLGPANGKCRAPGAAANSTANSRPVTMDAIAMARIVV